MAVTLTKAGDLSWALILTGDLTEHAERNMVLVRLGFALAEMGATEDALSVFSDATAFALADESDLREMYLDNLAMFMAMSGFTEDVRNQLDALTGQNGRDFALSAVASYEGKSSDLAPAYATVDQISSDYIRVVALLDIAVAQYEGQPGQP